MGACILVHLCELLNAIVWVVNFAFPLRLSFLWRHIALNLSSVIWKGDYVTIADQLYHHKLIKLVPEDILQHNSRVKLNVSTTITPYVLSKLKVGIVFYVYEFLIRALLQ